MHFRGEMGAEADAQEVIPPITDDLSIGGIDYRLAAATDVTKWTVTEKAPEHPDAFSVRSVFIVDFSGLLYTGSSSSL